MPSDPLAARLEAICGPAHVLTDRDQLLGYERDWTGRFQGSARLAVRPATTAEVAAVVRECWSAGVPLVAQGGNTSLVAGAIPDAGQVVLSTVRLDGVEVHATAAEALAGAGVTLEALEATVRPNGLRFGVDLASRASATLGGMVATNAGGVRVLRYGMTRSQLAGFEAVLADGSVVSRLNGAGKDNTGYDLAHLFAGSEGTLAVLSRLRLRLVPDPPFRAVALLGLGGVDDALATVASVRALPGLEAAELFFAAGLDLVLRHAGMQPPFAEAYPAYLLLESAGHVPQDLPLAEALGGTFEDAALAADARDRARLWAFRERHTEAVNAEGVPHKFDVAVPLPALSEFVARAEEVVARLEPGARVITFGHVAEGNLHVNVLGLAADDERVDEAVLKLVASLGGSISAEHGIGRAKKRFLHLTRAPEDIAAMRAVKHALDPRGILNPGVLFPD